MAPKDKHRPENRTIQARWKRMADGQGARVLPVYMQEYGHNILDGLWDAKRHPLNLPGALLLTCAPLFYGVAQTIDTQIYEFPQPDASVSFQTNPVNADGYLAVSKDDGHTGYVLQHDEGQYHLYEFDGDERVDDKLILTYIADEDDAWRIARGIYHDYNRMIAATEDINIPLVSSGWEVLRAENMSALAMDEQGQVIRFVDGFIDQGRAYASIQVQYNTAAEIWTDATQAFLSGQTGMNESFLAENAEEYKAEEVRYASLTQLDEMALYGALGLSALFVGIASAATSRRRLQNESIKKNPKKRKSWRGRDDYEPKLPEPNPPGMQPRGGDF